MLFIPGRAWEAPGLRELKGRLDLSAPVRMVHLVVVATTIEQVDAVRCKEKDPFCRRGC